MKESQEREIENYFYFRFMKMNKIIHDMLFLNG